MDTTSRNRYLTPRIIILIIVIVCLLLPGCDVHSGRRPYDYGTADWICEDPGIIIHVYSDRSTSFDITDIEVPDSVNLYFSYGRDILFVDESDAGGESELLRGSCTFGSKRMKVLVTQDVLFDGKYVGKTIIFTRVDNDT